MIVYDIHQFRRSIANYLYSLIYIRRFREINVLELNASSEHEFELLSSKHYAIILFNYKVIIKVTISEVRDLPKRRFQWTTRFNEHKAPRM